MKRLQSALVQATLSPARRNRVMSAGRFVVVAVSLVSLLACSAAPLQSVITSPPPADKARLYVYRDATLYGSQVWTAVSLNRQATTNTISILPY